MVHPVWLEVDVEYYRDGRGASGLGGILILGTTKGDPREISLDEVAQIYLSFVIQKDGVPKVRFSRDDGSALFRGAPEKEFIVDLAGFLEIPPAALPSYRIHINVVRAGIGELP